MKILIAHLSDIHLKDNDNSVLKKKDQIFNAIQSLTMEAESIFIVVSGDIACSGKGTEYEQAKKLFESIKSNICESSNKEICFIIVPGNHDCDFEGRNNKTRDTLIENIQRKKYEAIDGGVIKQCCAVQDEFHMFLESYQNEIISLHSDNLIRILEYEKSEFNIIFNCYNTSWISQKHEQPGKMFFPNKLYPENYLNLKSDLSISVMHHTFNWLNPANANELCEHIEETSDLVLTGHNHITSKSRKDDLEGNYTEYFEGSVLQEQEHANDENSGFNAIVFDLESKKQMIHNYKWNGEMFSLVNTPKWLSYERNIRSNKKIFEINSKFEEYLNDPGAAFIHPNRSKLVLDDFFVFPDLRPMDLETITSKGKIILSKGINSKILCEINEKNKFFLMGSDRSGKTRLCKVLFKYYYNNDYVPIYIEGSEIKQTNFEGFNKLINKLYKEQYSDDSLEKFIQLGNSKKLLIIDDFDKSKHNVKYKSILLKNINRHFHNIIITTNDMFQVEEFVYEEEQINVFDDYKQFKIQEFGHLLRSNLIEKWNLLGQEIYVEESDLIRKTDNAKNIVDSIIGKNLVPSYPLFLLTILQTIEAGIPHNLEQSSYGYYYHFLIIQSLSKLSIKNDEIEAYYNFLAELANHLFKNNTRELSKDDFVIFHKWYCEEYTISYSFENLINPNELIKCFGKANIIEENNNTYRFRYKYVYYFFVAKFISDNITDDVVRKMISEMCKRLYREEFANIIMFLTHHSKDTFVLDEILAKARMLFSELLPVEFGEDISVINDLLVEIPKLVLEDRKVKHARDEKYKSQDEAELLEKQKSNENDEICDLEEDVVELDLISKFNLSFKTIEILGQILKNYHSSLKGTKKLDLGEEAYFLGLRSIHSFFTLLMKSHESLVKEITLMIKKHKLVEKDKIEDASRLFLFELCFIVSYSLIKKISGSIGSEKLSETFKKILSKHDSISVNMIDMSIKLDFFKGIPYHDIKKLKRKISGNNLSYTLLKQMVIDYLYMFPTSYKDKQKICNILGITVKVCWFSVNRTFSIYK